MSTSVNTLENGLTVVCETNKHVETVSLGVWLNVGSRHESQELNGVAHVLEHMAFKGTTTKSAKVIAETIENVGGYINAYTSREKTAYYIRLLKEHVELGIDILSDILQNSTFLESEFKREQEVILQEIGQTYDTPDDIVFDYFQETCFPGQPLGRPILGPAENVKSFTPEVVKKYMTDHYGAKQMILSAAGNIETEKLLDLTKQYFTKLKPDQSKPVETGIYKGGDFRQHRPLEQVHVVLGFQGVPYKHPDYYPLALLSSILGGGMSSRLFQEIREKRGLVYTIYAFHAPYRDNGIFGIYAGTSQEKANELIDAVGKELKTFVDSSIETELNRSKAQLKASLMMSLESTSSRSEQMASQMHIYGKLIKPQEILKKIEAITANDIKEATARILTTPITSTLLGPINGLYSYEEICKKFQ